MKKRFLFYLVIFAVFMVIACPMDPPAEDPDPDPPPTNNLPTATIPNPGMEIIGSGEAGVNGVYDETGTFNTKPLYIQAGGGGNKIFWTTLTAPAANDFWCIYTDETETDGTLMEYISFSSADTPPLVPGVWSPQQGAAPSPTLSPVEIFTGSATVGGTLTIQYVFSDPDAGDTEGTTTFRWFLCADPADAGVEISGATSVNYTIQPGDAGSYLKAEVTPVDNHGLGGTAVVSSASAQIP